MKKVSLVTLHVLSALFEASKQVVVLGVGGGGGVANLAGPTAGAGRRCSHLRLHSTAEHWRAELLLLPACC